MNIYSQNFFAFKNTTNFQIFLKIEFIYFFLPFVFKNIFRIFNARIFTIPGYSVSCSIQSMRKS